MTKIGRNDECPCRSGKKYKNCCMEYTERDEFLKNTLNAQYIDPDYMLESLMQSSPILHNYLFDTLRWIRKPIVWLLKPDLKGNIRSIDLYEDSYTILLRQVPIVKEDHFDIAHEIGHLVLEQSGYPSVTLIENDPNKAYLASVLNSAILDPVINRQLKQYGFDFKAHIKKVIDTELPTVHLYSDEDKLHKYDKYFLSCLMIQKSLDWNLLDDDIDNPFEDLFIKRYPNIYSYVLEMTRSICTMNWGAPNTVVELLNKIIKDNDMEDTIKIAD